MPEIWVGKSFWQEFSKGFYCYEGILYFVRNAGDEHTQGRKTLGPPFLVLKRLYIRQITEDN